jgi:hypothetical protein
MKMNKKTRNPLVGLVMAIVFIGFGAYRLYSIYILDNGAPIWRVILAVLFVLYGLFLVYQLIKENRDKNYQSPPE